MLLVSYYNGFSFVEDIGNYIERGFESWILSSQGVELVIYISFGQLLVDGCWDSGGGVVNY